MFRRLPRSSLVVLAVWLLWRTSSLAANLGIVHGTVHDATGRPIRGVEVTLFARQNVRVDSHVTDAQGHFEFEQVQFGRYRLSFAAPDGRLDERELQIASGDVLEQDVTLPTLQETVTVVAPGGRRRGQPPSPARRRTWSGRRSRRCPAVTRRP